MATAVYNFPSVVRGNTFNKRKITFPFDISGACIVMQFCKREGLPMVFEWKTADNTLEIISATEMNMTERTLTSAPLAYVYDLVITFLDGTVFTYFKGTLEITQNTSNGLSLIHI